MKTPIVIPTICPTCNASLVRNGPFLECSNKNCPEVKVHQIMKWINKMDIQHLARKTLDKLMEAGVVTCIADIYKLTLNSVQGIDGIGQGFQRIIDEINRSRNPSLAKFLGGFDMESIGERIWESIINELKLKNLNDIFSLTANKLTSVNGIGETRAIAILENLAEMGEELIETSKVVGVAVPTIKQTITGSLSGISFCFTGALNTMKRAQAEEMVTSKGGIISSVKKGLSYLVTNDKDSGSAKNTKAAELGIKLINELEFLEMIK